MLRAGGGHIVNMASIASYLGTAGLSAYVAAKHGVLGLHECLELELVHSLYRVDHTDSTSDLPFTPDAHNAFSASSSVHGDQLSVTQCGQSWLGVPPGGQSGSSPSVVPGGRSGLAAEVSNERGANVGLHANMVQRTDRRRQAQGAQPAHVDTTLVYPFLIDTGLFDGCASKCASLSLHWCPLLGCFAEKWPAWELLGYST